MHAASSFLTNLALVLCVAAATSVVFQRLRLPVVLGYILAGLIIGPHVPVPLVAERATVETLSELGVILLMFSLGLEFSVRRLVRVAPIAGPAALIECSIMVWLGFVAARALGWSTRECLFAGAAIAISSTTIIAKVFDERRIGGRVREFVLGMLVVEDLVAILLLTVLTLVATGKGLSAAAVTAASARLALFLAALVGLGLLVVPRLVRFVVRSRRGETTLVASIGICFAMALLAQAFGYSVALGAFLGGALVAESGEARTIEEPVQPVRDMFAAVFFVAVGMLIDPQALLRHWPAVMVMTVVTVVGKVVSVSLGAFLATGNVHTSVRTGLSMAQIGEFSFIIAGLGLSLGATRKATYAVLVAVSLVTTLLTPLGVRVSGVVADRVDRALPKPFQTFAALYGSWLERLRTAEPRDTAWHRTRRWVVLLLVDAALLAVVAIGASLFERRIAGFLTDHAGISDAVARGLVVAAALALAAPFVVGVVRLAQGLGRAVADLALPAADGTADLAAVPRRALRVTLQLGAFLLVGVPLVAVTQPFLPALPAVAVVLAMLGVTVFAFWWSAENLQGHVRAGAELVLDVLSKEAQSGTKLDGTTLDKVRQVMPGIGELVAVAVASTSPASGRTLAELNLRGVTGATVLAISRDDGRVVLPAAGERLRPGDVLALAGSNESIESARRMIEPIA